MNRKLAIGIIALQFAVIVILGLMVADLAVWNDDLRQGYADVERESKNCQPSTAENSSSVL